MFTSLLKTLTIMAIAPLMMVAGSVNAANTTAEKPNITVTQPEKASAIKQAKGQYNLPNRENRDPMC